ncbi:MAG: hypothetical protein QNJ46_07925 [Leptolyngbyaceae cyanobacterium MO_188.B28]|nr:hypothetical protein [Leptolyngbyaceae cyanobacterium MO_188.B28]
MALPLYKTVKGLTDAVLVTSSGKLLVLPTAAGSALNLGQEITEIQSMSKLGERVIVDTYNVARLPSIQLSWQQKNLTLLGMRLGYEFLEQTNVGAKVVANGFRVTIGEYPGAGVGFEGNGMPADQTDSIACWLPGGDIQKPLQRQPFATFNPAVPESFAQGPDGATKWSNDLVAAKEYVGFEFPHELASAIRLSEESYDNFRLTMMSIMTDRSLLQWNFPSVSVKLDEGDINLNEPEMQITFRVQDDGSTCLPYDVIYKGQAQRRKCAA